MKIKSLEIIGMHHHNSNTPVTYEFNNMQYVYGRNGVGKSTILQAIQLALLGYIPGTDKNKSAIFAHANGNTMSVQLTFDDGSWVKRTWTNAGKDIKATVITFPEDLDLSSIVSSIELPIFNFNEFVGLTANKLKAWFSEFLPSNATAIDIRSELQSSAVALGIPTEIIESCMSNVADNLDIAVSDIKTIQELNAQCKTYAKVSKDSYTKLQGALQSMVYYNECEDIGNAEELKSEIKQMEIKFDNLKGKLNKLDHNKKIETAISNLELSADTLNDDTNFNVYNRIASDLTDEINILKADVPEIKSNVARLEAEIVANEKIISGNGICSYTNSQCDTMLNKLDELKRDTEKLHDALSVTKNQLAHYTDTIREKESEASSNIRKANAIKALYDKRDILKAQMYTDVEALNIDDISESIAQLESEISEKRDLLVKVLANEEYNKYTELYTKKKFEFEQEMQIYKAWTTLTDVNGLQTQVLNAPFRNLGDDLSVECRKLFGNDVSAMINVGEKANSFSFGILRNDAYIEYNKLSSGEKCLYTLALLVCITRYSDSSIKLIMIDDLLDHLDESAMYRCFDYLYNLSDIQTILAGVQECKHEAAITFATEVKRS